MNGIGYRTANPADAPALSALGRRTFVETFGHLYSQDDLAAFLKSHDEERWAEQLEDPDIRVRVAEDGGRLAAYAKLSSPTLPITARGPSAELRQLYVLKSWQGTGISRELMRWVIAAARRRGAEDLYLSVYVDNHRARRFYESYGFEFVAPYAFMVGNQADEDLILRLSLGG